MIKLNILKNYNKIIEMRFKVDNVEQNKTLLEPVKKLGKEFAEKFQSRKIETCGVEPRGQNHIVRISDKHGFISAAGMAYDKHYPLAIAPQHIWLMVLQSLSQHVNFNAERLRNKFVDWDGQKTLQVRDDSFVRGSPNNPWYKIFQTFSQQINKHIKIKGLADPFSTTNITEQLATDATLMDSMKSYFKYEFYTMCGIPEIHLEGTFQDWQNLVARFDSLANIDDGDLWTKWHPVMKSCLQHFVDAYEGRVDQAVWSNFFKKSGGSGGPYISGWINIFFLYNSKGQPSPYTFEWTQKGHFSGNTSNRVNEGLSSTPFKWFYHGDTFDMECAAGFVGVEQYPDATLRPAIGWAVLYK